MLWAKQSVAVTVVVGPVLDSTGAEYASAVIGDMSISKNGGTLTAMASAATLTYIANGMYTLVTRTTDMDTLGRCQITCNKSTYQMPKQEFMVLPATVFDALVTNATNTTGGLPAATGAIAGLAGTIATTTNITAATGITLTPTTGFGTQTGTLSTVTTATTATNVTTVNGLAANVITATSIATGAFTATKFAAGAFDAVWTVASRTLTAISDSSGITTLLTRIVGTLASGTHNPQSGDSFARLGAPAGASVSADIASVKADTDNIGTDWPLMVEYDALLPRFNDKALEVVGNKVDTLLGRITATLFNGITSLGDWIRRIARKDAGTAGMIAAEAEIDTGGTSTFTGTTDSLEAIRDAGGGGGGGGDPWTTDVSTGYTYPEAGAVLKTVYDKAALITSGSVQFTSMVNTQGKITTPIHIGDDYLASNGRAFEWTIDARSGFVVGTSTCKFGGYNAKTESEWLVTGTVSDLGGGEWKLSFDLDKDVTSTLEPGVYQWSVEIANAGGDEITEVYSGQNVTVKRKQT
jgi:hypothetical protein